MRTVLTALLFVASALQASAGTLMTGVQDVRILNGWRMANGNHMVAIEVILDQGWKTYWRAPGPLGIPPRFAWGASKNIKSVRTRWPTPTVFVEKYGQSIGYQDFVVIPVEITPKSSGPIQVDLTMDFGICDDICVPARANLTATLNAAEVKSKSDIEFALRSVSQSNSKSGHTLVCDFEHHRDGLQLNVSVDGDTFPPKPTLVFEHRDGDLWFDRTSVRQRGYSLVATSVLNLPKNSARIVERNDIRVTMLGGRRAVAFSGCPAAN